MAEDKRLRRQIHLAEPGAWLMTASSLAGLIAALIYYFRSGDGIAYTPGALLVVISTALLLAASLVLATGVIRHWLLNEFLMVSTALDILGTGFAAWLLEAHWLLAFTIVAAIGWITRLLFDAPLQAPPRKHSDTLQEVTQ